MARRGRVLAGIVREAVVGSERRIGLWILPLFVMVALLAATLAGTLTVLYYGQRVRSLEEATAGARAELDTAVERVNTAAEAAEAEIEAQLGRLREQLAEEAPVVNPGEHGIFAVSARHPSGAVRVGSAFTVITTEQETVLIGNYRVVALPDGTALRAAEVHLPQGTFAAAVHSFDPGRDVALYVLSGGPLPVPQWRPASEPISLGDRLWVAGVGGQRTAATLMGQVAGFSRDALLWAGPLNEFVAGGPVVDSQGRVVAVSSLAYSPSGRVDGSLRYALPIRVLCRELVRCTAEDAAAEPLPDSQGVGDVPRQQPPQASPSPQPSPGPSPEPAESPPPPDGGEETPPPE